MPIYDLWCKHCGCEVFDQLLRVRERMKCPDCGKFLVRQPPLISVRLGGEEGRAKLKEQLMQRHRWDMWHGEGLDRKKKALEKHGFVPKISATRHKPKGSKQYFTR